jgi:hypothetical protein
MKKIVYATLCVLICTCLASVSCAQAPQSFKYQSVARDNNGFPKANASIGLRINIHDLTETGVVLYQETHAVATNDFGLFSISVGAGTPVSGTFSAISWGSGEKFIEVEADFAGGSSYTSMGTSPLLSVPYALYSASGNAGPQGTPGTNGLNILNGNTDPTAGIGLNGEFYINTTSATLFGPKASGTWPAGVSLKGAAGTNGTNGLNILNGTTNPTSGIGQNGEFYINTSSSTLFGPKASGTWPAGVSLIGPSGSATNAWGLTGNSGTVDGTNFIGTTDNVPLNFKVNNQKAGRIDNANVFMGVLAGQVNSGFNNVGIGSLALASNTSGHENVAIGNNTLVNATTGYYNVAIGTDGLYLNTTGFDNTVTGYRAMYSNTSGYENTATGLTALFTNTTGFANTATGNASLFYNSTGYENTATGFNSLASNTTGTMNTASGAQSLYSNTVGVINAAFGRNALYANTTGSVNSAFGSYSLAGNTTGDKNTAIGGRSLLVNTTGAYNTALGNEALSYNTTGNNNTVLGSYAGLSQNWANANTTGSYNTFIGSYAGPGTPTQLTNATAIGYNSVVSASNSLVLGGLGTDAVKVGIGVPAPSAVLDIAGNIKIADGTQGAGKVLTSDTNGVASWTTPSSSAWGLTGNTGTVDGTNFIGTTDNMPLNFKVNNQKAGRIDPSGPTFLGYQAGKSNTTGLDNVGIGYQALTTNTTGYRNTSVGYQSSNSNTTGDSNSAFGYISLFSNTTGYSNTAIGSASMYNNTTGFGNTALGWASLWGNTIGAFNIAIGNSALSANSTGQSNTAVGYYSLLNNSTGNSNLAIGYTALYTNTIGNNNVASGAYSLEWNSTGSENTANGNYSLFSNNTGGRNTAMGYNALYNNTSGIGNTAIGWYALQSNATSDHNTALGYNAFSSGTSYSNSTAIGYNAQVTASNMIRLGDANITSINGAVDFTVVSDGRFKKDITENVTGLNFIMKLRPVTYHIDPEKMAQFMKTPERLRSKDSELAKEKVLQTGFIAQEVEQAAKNSGYDFSGVDKPENEKDYYGLRYAEFTVPLVKAVQEQQAMIEILRKEIQSLKEENSSLKETIESRLKKLEASLAGKESESKTASAKP